MPEPVDKIKNKFRWRILIKCKKDESIIDLVNDTLNEFYKLKTNAKIEVRTR